MTNHLELDVLSPDLPYANCVTSAINFMALLSRVKWGNFSNYFMGFSEAQRSDA